MPQSERARERECHRYYQTWLDSSRGYLSPKNVSRNHPLLHDDGVALHEATQRISRDKALVAFAQLGCLRLNVKRGIVTLISSSTSYILAEATQTISLLSGGQHAPGDELWFGTASIPRSQGISENALEPPMYTAQSSDGQSYSAPALVIADMTLDSRSSGKVYVGNGTSFYAGVPIVTASGFAIGVYTFTDNKPRPAGLTVEELQFMQDVASTVMDHLENIHNDTARLRGEKMVLGLGAFTQGEATMDADVDNTVSARETSSQTSRSSFNRSTFKGITITETDPNALRHTFMREESSSLDGERDEHTPSTKDTSYQEVDLSEKSSHERSRLQKLASDSNSNSAIAPHGQNSTAINTDAELGGSSEAVASKNQSSLPIELRQTFARAANILRQCTGSDGVMFFDAQSVSVGNSSIPSPVLGRGNSNDTSTSSDDTMSSSGGSSDEMGDYEYFNRPSPERDHETRSRKPFRSRNCDMLGYSFRLSSVATVNNSSAGLAIRDGEMRRFIRRYPKGLVMHFTKDGEVSSSDESSGRDQKSHLTIQPPGMTSGQKEKKRVIAKELIKVVPGARNVIFLPLWDFSKSRWSTGCFVWSSRPERLLNAQEDLVYLKAFANTVMCEINRLEAIASDQAKTSFVANISHELRSPLHGILGSIEFLQDTAVDPFQASMITTVETCGKTLLDTVNHVLDFAKLSKRAIKKDSPQLGGRDKITPTRSNLEADVDLSVIVEEVVEAIYAGQTFRSTGAFHGNEDEGATFSPLDDQPPTRIPLKRIESKFSGAVRLLLDIERLDSWYVRTQPGALRRIVMNLLGNALKYTESGLVCVSLQSIKGRSRDKSGLSFCITVSDTGKGMSIDFARNHAWEAFSQEDSFAHGVGLGLSIVRHITTSLGGNIDLQSSKGKGTEIKISLTVPFASTAPNDAQNKVRDVAERVKRLRLCILDPEVERNNDKKAEAKKRANDAIRRMVSCWFGMEVFESATVKDVTTDFFIYIEPPSADLLIQYHGVGTENIDVPLIVMTSNAFESATLRKDIRQLKDLGRTIDIISQPCGPQKLAGSFERCLYRDAFTAPPDILNSPSAAEEVGGIEDMIAAPGHQGVKSQPAMSHSSTDTQAEASSEAVEGSTFPRIYNNHRALSASSDGKSITPFESANKHPVLLVDDNEINLKLLVAFVRKARFPYVTAQDGLQALKLYKEASKDPRRAFKAVVIDIQMPVMDGVTATREIRAFESKQRIHPPATVVALTGLASEAMRLDCAGAGVSHFLSKPVKFKDFLKLLER